jgi:hypothetical protein
LWWIMVRSLRWVLYKPPPISHPLLSSTYIPPFLLLTITTNDNISSTLTS